MPPTIISASRRTDIPAFYMPWFMNRLRAGSANPTREECGCVTSRDIGVYDTCPYGCVYCYANASHAAAIKGRQQHDPLHETLVKK